MSSIFNDTISQIAGAPGYAKTQTLLVNPLTKDNVFLREIPMMESTHGLFNKYEEVDKVAGVQFGELDSPITDADVSFKVKQINLRSASGKIEVGEDRLRELTNMPQGGYPTYVEKRSKPILNAFGEAIEKDIIYNAMIPTVMDYNRNLPADQDETFMDAGGSGDGLFHLLAIAVGVGENCGLYSPTQPKGNLSNESELLSFDLFNGGSLYQNAKGQAVYGGRYKAFFGFQIARPDRVGVIANIASADQLTPQMVSELLARVKGSTSDTYLVCSHIFRSKVLEGFKENHLKTMSVERDYTITYETFGGHYIAATSNMNSRGETQLVL